MRIIHRVASVRQPSANDCWAAATAMARGVVDGHHLTVWQVKQTASSNGVRLNNNGSLPEGDLPNVRRLASAFGMTVTDMRSAAISGWQSLIGRVMRHGPIVLLGGLTYPTGRTATNHAITIYRMWGDGSGGGTTVSFVDPFDGRYYNFTWSQFGGDESALLADPHFLMGK